MSTRSAGVVSGLLAALAFPPFGIWPLAFVALVPLTLALSSVALERWEVSWGGICFGGVFYGIVLHWVPFTLSGILPFGALVGVLTIVLLAGIGGFQATALHRLLRLRTPLQLALPAVWVGTEVALAYAGPLAYPWTPLGLSLAGTPELAGPSEWVGVLGLSLWIALVNGSFAGVATAPRGARVLPAAMALLFWAGPALAGVVRDRTLQTEPLPPVLLTQIDVPRDLLMDPDRRDAEVGGAIERILGGGAVSNVLRSQENSGLDRSPPVFAILPEAPFRSPWSPAIENRMRAIAAGLGSPLLVGGYTFELEGGGEAGAPFNVVQLVEPSSATPVHAKRRLVPAVERPGFQPGSSSTVLELAGLRIALAICFEAAFGRDVRRARLDGAQILVNPTNDGWFRPALPWVGSAALAQYRAHLVLRAIENRMSAVRSSLGGELLAVGPDGRIEALRVAGGEGVVVVQPSVGIAATGYARHGDFAGFGAALTLVILLVRRRKPPQGSGMGLA